MRSSSSASEAKNSVCPFFEGRTLFLYQKAAAELLLRQFSCQIVWSPGFSPALQSIVQHERNRCQVHHCTTYEYCHNIPSLKNHGTGFLSAFPDEQMIRLCTLCSFILYSVKMEMSTFISKKSFMQSVQK